MTIYTISLITPNNEKKFDSFDNYMDASNCAIDLVRHYDLQPGCEIKLTAKELTTSVN